MFEKKVDLRSRKEMISFLANHYRYFTANSWNLSSSYANKVKLYNLEIPKELKDKAWDVICGDVECDFFDFTIPDLIRDFEYETSYSAGFNGRSGGYIVMYDGEWKYDEHKSYCPICGQKNFKLATETDKKCGRCGSDSRRNYEKPIKYYSTYPGRGIDSDDEVYFKDWSMSKLKKRVQLVQRFDRLCDDILNEFIYYLENGEIEEEEYTVTKTKKVLVV